MIENIVQFLIPSSLRIKHYTLRLKSLHQVVLNLAFFSGGS